MNGSRLLALSAACLLTLSLAASDAFAQAGVAPLRPPAAAAPVTPAGGAGASVALLDVQWLFKQLPQFKQMMDQLKADVEQAEAWAKEESGRIQKLRQGLEAFRGKPEYNAKEEQIARAQSDLAVKVTMQKREFVQRETRIYYNVYVEIQQEVDKYCAANGIDVVLRFNGDRADPERPDSVLQYVNREVVSYTRHSDITLPILEEIAKRRGYQVIRDGNTIRVVDRRAAPGPGPTPLPFR